MLRRQARLRREYIYRKSIEQRQKTIEDKKNRLKQAIDGIEKEIHSLYHQQFHFYFYRKSKNTDRSS